MSVHAVAGLMGVLLEFISMAPYFRDIVRGTTKPHVFTWLGWALVNTVVGTAQFVSGAAAGVLVTAAVALTCFVAAGFALFRGEKNITKSDWACLIGSIGAIGLWILTSSPLSAIIVVTLADVLAFIPTVRKAFYRPWEETAATFALGAARDVFALLALQSLTIVNWLYPATLLLSDGGFTALLLIRRRRLSA